MSRSLLITNGTILTMNDALDVVHADLLIRDGRIAVIGASEIALAEALLDEQPSTRIDASGAVVMPGFIHTHIHLCQTLFRGLADDLPLLDWLSRRVWPLEAAHDERTLRSAARLAAAELQLGGTTAVLTMETVHGTDAVFDALVPTGLRAVVGKCMMNSRGAEPARLYQPAAEALDESLALHARWHGAGDGRLHAALAPRFALSCTRELLEATAAAARQHGLIVHTHASEQRAEIALVKSRTGRDNLAYFEEIGLANEKLCAAHCVWTTDAELDILAARRVNVLHCPGSNLKLGSGLAPVVEMRARGIHVSLGADGAACNNALDMFQEMRLAATLQAVRHGPGALTARDAVWMATREGAKALGLDQEIGSIEEGKKADVIVVGVDGLHQQGWDFYSTLVYSSRPTDVRATIIDGRVVARDGHLSWADRQDVVDDGRQAAKILIDRAKL